MNEPFVVREWWDLVQQVSGQYIPTWWLLVEWVELFLVGYEEWFSDFVCASVWVRGVARVVS